MITMQSFTVSERHFPAPTTYPSTSPRLTATDAGGLQDVSEIDISRNHRVTLANSPPVTGFGGLGLETFTSRHR